MEQLYEFFNRKLQRTPTDFLRYRYHQIKWNGRAFGLVGPRGVGKSTMLLQYIKLNLDVRDTLYVSADHLYFSEHKLVELADRFVKMGGKHLFVDEIHKYEGWSQELKEIHDLHKDLHVVVSGSSLIEMNNGKADLSRRMVEYEMRGLSFREYLGLETGNKFDTISLENLLENASAFCNSIKQKCRPLEYFRQYLISGYYPFFFEDRPTYGLRLENIVNYTIDTELTSQRNIETGNTRKIKALLQVISGMLPF